MKPENILQANVLDIIFENRNKEYGAYQIRKQYSVQLIKGLGIALGGIFFLVFLISFKTDRNVTETRSINKGEVKLIEIDPLQPVAPEPPPAPEIRPQFATEQFVTPLIVPETEEITTPVPDLGDLETADISNEKREGAIPDGTVHHVPEQSSGPLVEATLPAISDEPYHQGVVEEPAEFPGGMKALVRFLERNLQDPRGSDIEEGAAHIKVQMQFVINKSGEVEKFNAVHSGGEQFNAEVIRVLKKMPRWKPARQHKQAVAMYYILPVTFAVN
ncbi:MAG: energy transducer TonB [Chitinophagaceae bacterium]|nr:energy transducer TonB [Chitinophagaceae bacterium]